MDILEQLWFGDINPCEQFLRNDTEYFGTLRKVVEEQERLLPGLSPQVQEIIEKLMLMQTEANVLAEQRAFAMGFRLAVQIMTVSMH